MNYRIKEHYGLVRIENPLLGFYHSCHPNIHRTGSVKGMIASRAWNESDKTLLVGGYIHNLSSLACADYLDEVCAALEYKDVEFLHLDKFRDDTPKFSFTYPETKENILKAFSALIDRLLKEGTIEDENQFLKDFVEFV